MKKYKSAFFIIVCCCICANLPAQKALIDSLEKVLATDRLKNAEKVELLIRLSRTYYYVDIEKCSKYGYEALSLAKDLGLKKLETSSYFLLSQIHSPFDSEKQREYAMEALQIAQRYGFKKEEADAYFALGVYYNTIIMPYQAHAHFIKAEKIYIQLDDKDSQYVINIHLMILFNNIEDFDNEIYYTNKVITMATERNDCRQVITAQTMLGDALFRDNKNQEAADYYLNLHQRALHFEDSLGVNKNLSSFVGSRCGDVYFQMNRFNEALPYLQQMRDFHQANGIITYTGMIYCYLAQVFVALNNIDSAVYYVNKANESHFVSFFEKEKYLANAQVDSLKGDYFSALANFQKYHQLSDSISKEEKSTDMTRLKVWHEFDQKEIEKKIMQQEYQKQQRLILILEIFSVLIFMSFTLSIFFYRKINQKNRELSELHATKDKLFSVIAHDLRSPVASLVSVLELTQSNTMETRSQEAVFKDISKHVDETYRLLDNLLRWAKNQMQKMVASPISFDIQAECAVITDILMTNASAKKITLTNHTYKQNVYADKDMFSVVLRNLTTNAIKFTPEGGEVTITSELSENMAIISVKDTGIGMTQEVQKNLFKLSATKSQLGTYNEVGTGLGLVLCADFIKANGGEIWFTTKEGEGSTFFFSFPAR